MPPTKIEIHGLEPLAPVYAFDLPGSKSAINRYLMMAALEGREVDDSLLDGEADDTRLMVRVLRTICDPPASHTSPIVLHCANAGAVARMASVFAAFKGGKYLITGNQRMLERPVDELCDLLIQGGIQVHWLEKPGYIPFVIDSAGFSGTHFSVNARKSSQHLSGLLLVAPYLPQGAVIHLATQPVSAPYILMTIRMMREAGAMVHHADSTITILPGNYHNLIFPKEADWSSAAFFFQAAALLPRGSSLLLKGLRQTGLQGDEAAIELYRQTGVTARNHPEGLMLDHSDEAASHWVADFIHTPDLFNGFAVTAAMCNAEATLTGLDHLVHKESDRLNHLVESLRENGFNVQLVDNQLVMGKRNLPIPQTLCFDSAGDHRVAISFALAALLHPVILSNPFVVSKSFPDFFTQLSYLTRWQQI
jgi:3-phosphoshikimate 1-carboxyvinyltransferase